MPDTPATPAPPPPPADPALAKALSAAQVAKAQADARKAGADADAAAAAARTAGLKAMLGDLPAPAAPSAVTTGENAALAEHNELARRALIEVAKLIADDLKSMVKGNNAYVTTNDAGPDRAAADSFAFHAKLVDTTLTGALDLSATLDPTPAEGDDGTADVIPLAAIGLVLSGINTALSYVRADYSLGGRVFQPGDGLLVTAVAEAMADQKKKLRVDGPRGTVPPEIRDPLITEVADLAKLANDARVRAAYHAAAIKRLSPAPTPAPAPPPKSADGPCPATTPDPNNERPAHEQALQSLNAAIKLYDDLEASLLAVTDGVSGFESVAAARALAAFLDDGKAVIIVLKLEGMFGSSLDEKSTWATIKGELPYKLSALVQASWRCFDPQSAVLLGCGLQSFHSGFQEITDI
jgi:hypothetical protein